MATSQELPFEDDDESDAEDIRLKQDSSEYTTEDLLYIKRAEDLFRQCGRIKLVVLSPQECLDKLQAMHNNRTLRMHHVRNLAKQHVADEFNLPYDPMMYDAMRRPRNAQHRLAMGVLSNKPVVLLMVDNVPEEMIKSQDRSLPWQVSDILRIPRQSQAMAQGIYQYCYCSSNEKAMVPLVDYVEQAFRPEIQIVSSLPEIPRYFRGPIKIGIVLSLATPDADHKQILGWVSGYLRDDITETSTLGWALHNKVKNDPLAQRSRSHIELQRYVPRAWLAFTKRYASRRKFGANTLRLAARQIKELVKDRIPDIEHFQLSGSNETWTIQQFLDAGLYVSGKRHMVRKSPLDKE
jgi:hypothetical protein